MKWNRTEKIQLIEDIEKIQDEKKRIIQKIEYMEIQIHDLKKEILNLDDRVEIMSRDIDYIVEEDSLLGKRR